MKTTSVTVLKNNLSAQLKEVLSGETILITDRRKPIASLQPLAHLDLADDVWDLCTRGIVSLPGKPLVLDSFLQNPRAKTREGLTSAILDERQER